MDKLLKVSEVAEILRVSKQTVHVMMKSGRLKFIRMGRNIRIFQSELDEVIENSQSKILKPEERIAFDSE